MESNFWAMQVQSQDHLKKEESNKDQGQTYSLEISNSWTFRCHFW